MAAKSYKKVLIVDDDPDLLAVISQRLKSEGYGVVVAANGIEALEKTKAENPDLIIMDNLMPGKSGFEVVSEIRRWGGKRALVPIIILSGKPELEDLFAGLEIKKFISKPFNTKELLNAVHGVME